MSYGFTVYTDRPAISKTKVYSQTSGKTYEYAYGTGQHSLSGFTEGDYLEFTAEPAEGYNFTKWTYHIGSIDPDNALESYVNPFTFYGSEGNDIYIAAEGSIGEPTGTPTISNLYIDTNPGSLDIILTIQGTNIIGCWIVCDLFYFNYSELETQQITTQIQITSNNFSTPITSPNYTASSMRVRVYKRLNGTLLDNARFTFTLKDYFQWSSDVYVGGPIKNVSHNEWNSFIDKIIAILTDKGMQNQTITAEKYGYAVGTPYSTMLQKCYLKYDSDYQGYPLFADQFNIARFIIGSHAPGGSGILEDKISRQSKVLASDFIKLEDALKAWQEET